MKEKPADASNESASEPSSAQGIKAKLGETWSKPEDATLKAAFRVSPSLNVPKGDDIHLSLEAPYNSADYSYRWLVYGAALPQGTETTYTIKTGSLNENQKYRVFCDVTKDGVMQRVIAFFELRQSDKETGIIDLLIINQETNQPEIGASYVITPDFDSTWSLPSGKTDDKGFIKINNAPLGKYTLQFDDPELAIIDKNS